MIEFERVIFMDNYFICDRVRVRVRISVRVRVRFIVRVTVCI